MICCEDLGEDDASARVAVRELAERVLRRLQDLPCSPTGLGVSAFRRRLREKDARVEGAA